MIEGLLLLALLSLGSVGRPRDKERGITVVNIRPSEVPEEAPEPSDPEREQRAEERPVPQSPVTEEPPPQTAEPRPVEPRPEPPARIILPTPQEQPPSAAVPRSPVQPAPPSKRVYGPPDRRSSSSRDTERVGTAPNGEPLYAAAWYR